MIEYIIGGVTVLVVGGVAYFFRDKIETGLKWTAEKLKIDTKKLGLDDAQELYKMVSEFIEGGEDGVIDATDALILLNKLQLLIDANKVTQEDA
jgi:hypothetical protein